LHVMGKETLRRELKLRACIQKRLSNVAKCEIINIFSADSVVIS
jgi:hypothetical protein